MTVVNDLNKTERIKYPEAHMAFKRLHNTDDPEVEQKEWEFWMGFRTANNNAGHFSQDEIDWVEEILNTYGNMHNEMGAVKGILKEMRKSQYG